MSVLVVPPLGDEDWPTLGPDVCEFIEHNLVHGPGDLRGEPARLDDEKRGLIYRMYEIYPRSHPDAGRRRFKRVALSLRKGSAKTELAAWLAACELHPQAPVRCVGWTKYDHEPKGGGVTDPYIPMVAYTREQSEDLAYAALLCIIEEGPLAQDFNTGLTRIVRRDGSGRAVALSNAPNARDGARTTFQVFDETHRLVLPAQKASHRTMLANIPKRRLADAWSLETTTAYSPGQRSVAEDTMEYARLIESGKVEDPKLFFFHRQAGEQHKVLETRAQIEAAVREASGPVAEWSDVSGIVDQWQDPTTDKTFLERVWLNRPVRQADRAFVMDDWRACVRKDYRPPAGALITLGFDGARFHDSTAIVGCEVGTGHLFLVGLWEKPPEAKDKREDAAGWEVPVAEVDSAFADTFSTWKVWRLYADPPYWENKVDGWAGEYGKDVVITWKTKEDKKMSTALSGFVDAMATRVLTHDGSNDLDRHLGNAVRRELRARDDQGKPLFCIQKERPDSLFKIDAAMAAVLAWEARGDAIKSGVLSEPEPEFQVLFIGGGQR